MENTNLLKSIEEGRALIEDSLVDVQGVMKKLALTSAKLSNTELLLEAGKLEDDAMTEKEVEKYNFLNRNFTHYVLNSSSIFKRNTSYLVRSTVNYGSVVEKYELMPDNCTLPFLSNMVLNNFVVNNIIRDKSYYITCTDLAVALVEYLNRSYNAYPNNIIPVLRENIATYLPFDDMMKKICDKEKLGFDNIQTINNEKCIVGISFEDQFVIHMYSYPMKPRRMMIAGTNFTVPAMPVYNYHKPDIVCDTEVISETSSENQCLTGDADVETQKGFKPIKEVKAEEVIQTPIEVIDSKDVNNEEIASFIKDERKTQKLTKRKWAEDIRRKIDLSTSLLGVTEKSVYKSIYDGFRTIYGIDPKTEAIRAYNDGLIAKPNGFEYISSNKETRGYFEHLFDELIKTRIKYAENDFLRCYDMTPTQKLRFENRIFEMVIKTIQLAVATGVDAKDISIMIRNNVVGYNSFRSKFKFNVLNVRLSPYIVIAYDDKKYKLWMNAWKKEMGDN